MQRTEGLEMCWGTSFQAECSLASLSEIPEFKEKWFVVVLTTFLSPKQADGSLWSSAQTFPLLCLDF